MVENSPFDLEGGSGSRLEEIEDEGLEEVALGGEEAALLAVRTAALALVLSGGLALITLTCRQVLESDGFGQRVAKGLLRQM